MVSEKTIAHIKQTEELLRPQFEELEEIRDYNQEKVLRAFIDNKVAPEHFYTVSGYGHDDLGKEVLDNVFAQVFKAEAALARNHFVSGTHTLACALFGNLRYGEKLVSVTGTPYDTMQEVIGTVGGGKRESLIGHGVLYFVQHTLPLVWHLPYTSFSYPYYTKFSTVKTDKNNILYYVFKITDKSFPHNAI